MEESTHDFLTGLPTRGHLERKKTEFYQRPEGELWSIVLIDIDHFKLINDIYGHLTGDEVLKYVASILETHIRKSDSVIRFGGDEFIGILPYTSKIEALNFAERVMEEMKVAVFPHNLHVSLSMGIADSSEAEKHLDDVLEKADKELYKAKETGRGRISFAAEGDVNVQEIQLIFNHFIGRQQERKKLQQLLDESIGEGGRFVLIEGEPGSGKTRLAEESLHYAKFRDCFILRSGCFEFGNPEPFQLQIAPIRRLFKELDRELAEISQRISPLNPATSELFPEIQVEITEDKLFFREERLKFKIFDDIARILGVLSELKPIVFIIDDIQWISLHDLELFTYLIRSLLKARIFFVATKRITSEANHPVTEQLQSLRRLVPFLTLSIENLDEQESSNLIMFALKDPNIPNEVLKKVYGYSGGNPFFLKELLTTLIQDQSITRNASGDWLYHMRKDLKLPESISQLLSSRVQPLSEMSRLILRVASLVSQSFTIDLLSYVTEKSEVIIAEALEGPLNLGLIREIHDNDYEISYRFVHDIVRNFLHRDISDGMKRIYHSRMAQYYEKIYQFGNKAFVTAMAYHYSQSGMVKKILESALLAARHAYKRQAFREASQWFELFLSHDDGQWAPQEDYFNIYRTLGEIYSFVGDGKKALTRIENAFEFAVTNKDKAQLLHIQGGIFQALSKYAQSRKAYRQALDFNEAPLRKADLHCSLAFLEYLEGNMDEARKELEESRVLLEQQTVVQENLDRYWAAYFNTRGIICKSHESCDDAYESYMKALRCYQQHGDAVGESIVLNNLSDIYYREGKYEEMLDVLKQAEQIALRLDDALTLAIVMYNLADTYNEINERQLSLDYFNRYQEINVLIGNELGQGYANLGLGMLAEQDGDYQDASKYYQVAMEVFKSLGSANFFYESGLHYVQVLILCDETGKAEEIFEHIDGQRKRELVPDLAAYRAFVKGLFLYKCQASGDMDREKLLKATTYFKEAHSLNPATGLYEKTMLHYYLMKTFALLKDDQHVRAVLSEAYSIITEKIAQVKNERIRKQIKQKKYVKLLLKEAELANFCSRNEETKHEPSV